MSEVEDVFGGSVEEETPKAAADVPTTEGEDDAMQVDAGETEKMVTESIDEDGDIVEETTEVTRKVVKRTMKITEVSNDFIEIGLYNSKTYYLQISKT